MSLVATKLAISAFITNTQTLDAAGEGVGVVFRAPLTDSVNRAHVYCVSTNGTPPSYAARYETIDANGLPTGTLVAGSAQQTFTPTAATLHSPTFASPAGLTAGTHYALIITDDGVTPPDGSNNATFLYLSGGGHGGLLPIAVLNTGGGYALNATINRWPAIMPQYDATTDRMIQGISVAYSHPQTSFDSGSTPDEYGVVFTVPVTMSLFGLTMPLRMDNNSSDFDISLYNGPSAADADLVVRLNSYDASFMITGTSLGFTGEFPTPRILSPGSNYHCTIRPSSLNNLRIRESVFASQALREAHHGADYQKVTRVNAGAFSNHAAEVVHMQLLFDTLVGGGGAVSLFHGMIQ